MEVRYRKGITGYWFYYSIGTLDYAVVYPSQSEFLKVKGYTSNEVKFKKISD